MFCIKMHSKIIQTKLFALCGVLFALSLYSCHPAERKDSADDPEHSPRMTAINFLWEGKFDEAEMGFKKAIRVDKNNILNYIDLALMYIAGSNYEEADKTLNEASTIEPGNTDIGLVRASMYLHMGQEEKAAEAFKGVLQKDTKNIPAYYHLSELSQKQHNIERRKSNLLKIVDISPANIAVLLPLTKIFCSQNNTDSALHFIQTVRGISPNFSTAASEAYQKAIALLQSNQPGKALPFVKEFSRLMESTRLYSDGFSEISLPALPEAKAEFNDSRLSLMSREQREVTLQDIQFNEVAEQVGLKQSLPAGITHSVLAVADDDGTGSSYVYASFGTVEKTSRRHFFKQEIGPFSDVSSVVDFSHGGVETCATFTDYDNDGYQDLFIATSKGIYLYQNNGDGRFNLIKKSTGLEKANKASKLLTGDFDQDGDLDFYTASPEGNQFFRNNGDGTFTEQAGQMGLTAQSIDLDLGDWDSDGDLDIVSLSVDGSLRLFNNDRHSKFTDITGTSGLSHPSLKGKAVVMGDYNNDGQPDLFLAGEKNGPSFLLKNTGTGTFQTDVSSENITKALSDLAVTAAIYLDFDNDGLEDILAGGLNADNKGGLRLLHNEGAKGFTDVTEMLPAELQTQQLALADFNMDGDDDIFLTGPGGLKLVRNDGGSLNHYTQVQLVGFSYGNSKNNRLGIGAQVELKAGDLYQTKTVRRMITNFGVGNRDSLDAVRIIWPNGSPQYISDPSRRQKLFEESKLKGSCPFLFVWNGRSYEFFKDMMWRSALGMPLAVNGKDTTFAFSDPSKEYLLIPGDRMKRKDNTYSVKITEELWETVFFDKLALYAVDHPDSVNVYADERFVAPPFPGKEVHVVERKQYPVSVTDEKGNDLLPKILSYDFQYIANFNLSSFQGLAEPHDLILDLGKANADNHLLLFLRGWIFPTDASINSAFTQSSKHRVKAPELQVINAKGEWQTVIPNIGFPMGKDKMVKVDLTKKFLTPGNRKIRIRTNMQIYWDEVFFSEGKSAAPVQLHTVPMTKAGLDFRGYSAMYRKGGPFGPHWFDYDQVSDGQQWRDLTGNYTRFGDVLPLLREADDEYIIANSGDEITVDFDAAALPPLPAGWKRDFLIYSEGWVKDGDLNTAHGQTVDPLPFHAMPSYPYPQNVKYPLEKHKAYMDKYNTRKVTTNRFRDALKP